MKNEFEVKRIRYSVTQGEAAVYFNGERLIQYADDIRFNFKNQYGEIMNGWASCRPDNLFIDSAKWDCAKKIKQLSGA